MATAKSSEVRAAISFIPRPERNSTQINYSYTTFIREDEGGFDCYIPGFEIYFSCEDKEESKKIGLSMTKSFFDFWTKEQGQKLFLLELHKRGFKTVNHNFEMQKMLNNRSVKKTKFNLQRENVPSEFAKAQKFNEEAKFAMAI